MELLIIVAGIVLVYAIKKIFFKKKNATPPAKGNPKPPGDNWREPPETK